MFEQDLHIPNSQSGTAGDVTGPGQFQRALANHQATLERDPNNLGALIGLSNLFARINRLDPAIKFAERAVEIDRSIVPNLLLLANNYRRAGRDTESARMAQEALALEPSNIAALNAAATALMRMRDLADARALNQRALQMAPTNLDARLIEAQLLHRAGDLATARGTLERMLATSFAPDTRRRILHELARTLEQLGEYDMAFQRISDANDAQATTAAAQRFDPDAIFRRIQSYREGFHDTLFHKFAGSALSPLPRILAFLVGFPRSGTTLLEQMLGAHPAIANTDERPMLQLTIQHVMQMRTEPPLPTILQQLDSMGVTQLRSLYEENLNVFRPEAVSAAAVVDKYPLNLMELGYISVVFPECPVIVIIRDPRDACLSCFMQQFVLNPAMVNFLSWERTCQLYAEVTSLYLQQKDQVANSIIEVHYRDLVRQPEPHLRRILKAMGLPWDARVLESHRPEYRRAVATPSAAAVQNPLYDSAIDRWKRYAAHFERVQHLLEPAIQALGYTVDSKYAE